MFVCTECDKKYSRQNNLRQHQKTHQAGNTDDDNDDTEHEDSDEDIDKKDKEMKTDEEDEEDKENYIDDFLNDVFQEHQETVNQCFSTRQC